MTICPKNQEEVISTEGTTTRRDISKANFKV